MPVLARQPALVTSLTCERDSRRCCLRDTSRHCTGFHKQASAYLAHQYHVCMLQLKSLNDWRIVLFMLQLKLRQLLIRVGRYSCGSLDVHISSAGMAITDKRHMPQMPRHLSILTITPDNTDPAKSASDVFAPWDTVRGFVNHNVSMPDFSRLTHRSSFERRHSIKRVQSGISPLLRHRVTSGDQEPAGELSLFGADSIWQCHEPTGLHSQ